MSQNLADDRRERAALLVAEGTHTNADIARSLGITRRTVERWRQHEPFQRRVAEIVGQFATTLVADSIADRQARVAALDDRWARMKQVIEQRALEMDGECAGGDTGLLVRQVKLGPDGTAEREYAVDTGLLREMRAHEQQAAQELGQWAEKREISGKDGGPIQSTAQVVFVLPPKSPSPDPGAPPGNE